MNTLEFLSALYEYADRGHTQLFSLPSASARPLPASDLSALPDLIASAKKGENLYFSPGLSGDPKAEKLSNADIIGIPALWADIDIADGNAHAAQNLPANVAEAMELIPNELAPSIIVHSGYGLHVWWLFKECWYFDTPEEKARAHGLLVALQAYIRQRASERGWHVDSTNNLDRVMRLPGTLNYKRKSAPIPATVIEHCDLRYDPSEIEEVIPAVDPTTGQRIRKCRFERRETDGPAAPMLQNCAYMQHAQLNAKTLTYQEWLAALTNIVRGSDGIDAAHVVSALDTGRYNQAATDKKIDECLAEMHPQSCEYIRRELGFKGCPEGGCGVKAPCGWSLGKVPQARAMVRSVSIPAPETVYQPEFIGALALIQKQCPVEYDIFLQKCKGALNINTLRSELKKSRAAAAGLTVHDGSGAGEDPDPAEAPEDDVTSVSGVWLQDTVPDAPLNLKLPRKTNTEAWVFKPNGVALRKVTANGETFNRAGYAPVMLTERIYNVDTCSEKARVAFKTRHGWRYSLLPKTTIFSGKGIMQLANSGLTLNEDMAKVLARWLSALEAANVDLIPERLGVSKLGWRSEETEFILPGLSSNYTLDAGSTEADGFLSAMATAGTFDAWREPMVTLRQRTRPRFLLAASFAAPLLKILGQRTFLVHNWGTTADGKTAALQAAMSVWGKPEELYRTFDNTKTSLEKTAELFTDLPLGINEYEVLNDRRKGEVDQIVYMIGEGKGRGRAKQDGTLQRASTWRTIAIMNGESPITKASSKGGIITRVIELHGGPFKGDEMFASELYRVLARNHGHAGRHYIEQLLRADHEKLRNIYTQTRTALRQAYAGKMEAHIDAISCVVLADFLASQWIFGVDQTTAGAEAIAMGEEILRELVTKNEASESERAWDWMQDWIAANIQRIHSDFNDRTPIGTIYGYSDAEFIYLIKNELSNALREEGYSPEKIYRQWADENRIPVTIRPGNGQKDYGIKRERIGGTQPWLIRIAK